jgi:peptide/nickel transport system permease protein
MSTTVTSSRPLRRRIGFAVLRMAATAVAAALLCGLLVRFAPGFGVDERQLDSSLSAETQQAIRQSNNILSGNLGFSQSLNRPIRDLLTERAPATATLMTMGVAGGWMLALLFAVPPVIWRRPSLASTFSVFSGVSACLPAAGIALLLFRFGASAKWMIPVILFPRLYQFTGNLLHQSYSMPHVLMARAKGLSGLRIFFQHVVPPAGGQLLALAAVSVNMAFGAAVAVEAICDQPGLGQLAWKAALSRDLPVLVVLTAIVALLTQVSNLLADAVARPSASLSIGRTA